VQVLHILLVLVTGFVLLVLYFIYNTASNDKKEYIKKSVNLIKMKSYTDELLKWLELRSKSKSITDFLNEKKIKTLSIYGAGDSGKILLHELTAQGLNVRFIIDRNPDLLGDLSLGKEIVLPLRSRDYGEAIIISLLHDADKTVKNDLESLGITIPIFKLREIISYISTSL